MKTQTRLIALALLTLGSAAWAAEEKVEPVKKAQLGATRNVHACGSLYFSGQPSPSDVAVVKAKGIKRVITLREDSEIDWEEAAVVKQAGLEFVSIPFQAPDSLTDQVFDKVRKLLKESDKTPTLLHCGSANRVGAVWLTHRVLDQGVPLEEAVKEAKQIGLRSPAYEAKARQYVQRQATDSK